MSQTVAIFGEKFPYNHHHLREFPTGGSLVVIISPVPIVQSDSIYWYLNLLMTLFSSLLGSMGLVYLHEKPMKKSNQMKVSRK